MYMCMYMCVHVHVHVAWPAVRSDARILMIDEVDLFSSLTGTGTGPVPVPDFVRAGRQARWYAVGVGREHL